MQEAPTPRDDVAVSARQALRKRLLRLPEVRERFAQLYRLWPKAYVLAGGRERPWPPKAIPPPPGMKMTAGVDLPSQGMLEYHEDVERLESDLDCAFGQVEIDELSRNWPEYLEKLDAGTATLGIGFDCGRAGKGYPRNRGPKAGKRDTIELAALSIALHADGVPWARADQEVADMLSFRERGTAGHVLGSTIAGYRKRLRDPFRTSGTGRNVAPRGIAADS